MKLKYKNKTYEAPDDIELYAGEYKELCSMLNDEDKELLCISKGGTNIPLRKCLCNPKKGNENITEAYFEMFKKHNVNVADYGKEVK